MTKLLEKEQNNLQAKFSEINLFFIGLYFAPLPLTSPPYGSIKLKYPFKSAINYSWVAQTVALTQDCLHPLMNVNECKLSC